MQIDETKAGLIYRRAGERLRHHKNRQGPHDKVVCVRTARTRVLVKYPFSQRQFWVQNLDLSSDTEGEW